MSFKELISTAANASVPAKVERKVCVFCGRTLQL